MPNLIFSKLDNGFSTLEDTGVLEAVATILLLPQWDRCDTGFCLLLIHPCDHRLFVPLL